MSADPSKIVLFPGAFDQGGAPAPSDIGAPLDGRWELVGPILGWGGTVLAIVCVDGPDGPVAFAGTTAGCFASIDGGATWEPRNVGLTSPYVQALAASPTFAKDRTLYAGTLGSGVMRSTNGGLTWGAIDFWQGPVAVTSVAVAIDAANDTVVLAGTASGGIFRSSNGGAHRGKTPRTASKTKASMPSGSARPTPLTARSLRGRRATGSIVPPTPARLGTPPPATALKRPR